MMGHDKLFSQVISAAVNADIPKAKGLTEFVRCQLIHHGEHYEVHSTGNQSSGVLSSLSLGEGLIIGAPELPLLPKGMTVKVLVLDSDEFARAELPF
jgi:molybdopterin molybdotransferase